MVEYKKLLKKCVMGPLAIPAIVGGSQLLGQGIGAFSQGKMNKKTRQWNEKMYAQQRQHALADWQMQNDYNSPAAQMRRFAEAGLNPNLIYGQSNEGTVVRSSSMDAWRPSPVSMDVGRVAESGLAAYYDAQIKPLQTDNLKAANAIAVQEAILKAAQTAATIAGTDKTKLDTEAGRFNLQLAQKLENISLQSAEQHLRKMMIDSDIALNQDARAERGMKVTEATLQLSKNRDVREKMANDQSIQESIARILHMQVSNSKTEEEKKHIWQMIHNLQADKVIKDLDTELKRGGVQPGDAIYWRGLVRGVKWLEEKSPDVRKENKRIQDSTIKDFQKRFPQHYKNK